MAWCERQQQQQQQQQVIEIVAAAFPFFFFVIHYIDSPDCLLLFLSVSVFYFLVVLFLHFLVVGSVR